MISSWIFSLYTDAVTIYQLASRIGLVVGILACIWAVIVGYRDGDRIKDIILDGVVALFAGWGITFLGWLAFPLIIGGMFWVLFL